MTIFSTYIPLDIHLALNGVMVAVVDRGFYLAEAEDSIGSELACFISTLEKL